MRLFKLFPQNNKWLYQRSLKVSKARKLNKNWGLGIAGTYYKTFLNKYISENLSPILY